MGVATYSTANVRNGNLLTAVPVVSWSGVGPDMNFALVHNSAHVTSGVNLSHTNGFNLGPGWQTSYSARLIFNNPNSATVVHDDGRMDTYTKIGTAWIAPAGVHDVLEQQIAASPRWSLTFKDQSSLEFNAQGRLAKVRDANGHALVLTRDAQYRVYKITDAAQQDSGGTNDGRKLLFDFDTAGRLTKIIDLRAGASYPYEYDPNRTETEAGAEPQGSTLDTRIWTLAYDATSGRLVKITDPMGFEVEIKSYDTAGRVTQIEDKDDDAFTYEYNADGQLWKVTDPNPGGGGTQYVQQLTYSCPPDPRRTTYTDRRGKAWLYEFSATGILTKFTNPLGQDQEYVFDAARNLTSYKDALDKEWTFTYDPRGNLLKTFTPLMPNSGQNPTPKSERTYDSLNNLLTVKDAAGNTVSIAYELTTTYPTLPTKITVPADGQGNGANDITISYYDSSTPTAAGQIEEVRQLAVRTGNDLRLAMFVYDDWGQPIEYGEGEEQNPCPSCPSNWRSTNVTDSGSNSISGNRPSGSGNMSYNSNGWPTGSLNCSPPIGGPNGTPPPPGFPQLPCGPPAMPGMAAGWDASEPTDYSKMGQIKQLQTNTGYTTETRDYTFSYDKLGRATSLGIASTNEHPDLDFTRTFTYAPEWADDGSVTRTGPDGKTTTVTLDDAGRTSTLSRDGVTATYIYNTRGLLERINYGNGAHVEHEYDDDQRLTSVEHYDAAPSLMLGLGYQYNTRDLPVSITESNSQGTQAVVGFAYDNRGRLIGETRTGATPYDMEYAYDQAGNRTSKLDSVAALLTLYEYDVDDPAGYQSDNNRLMKSEMYDVSGAPVLVETKWYYYVDQNGYDEGCVNRIVTRDHTLPGAPHYTAVRMEYDKAVRVAFMLGEEWDDLGNTCPDNYSITWAREFRYDEARARYLNRELNPEELESGNVVALSETWTDYDGDESYGDFEIDAGAPPTIDNLRSYQPGVSAKDPGDQATGISYYHSDMLGTTRGMTNASGSSASTVAYTAFGEKITPGYHRYGYAGSWGYQAHDFPTGEGVDPVPFLHVGWRYYDPGTGRFLQRDPIGIEGGLNAYEYVDSEPTAELDPDGLSPPGRWDPRLGRGTGRVRLPSGRIGNTPWWRGPGSVGTRLTLIGICGWLAAEFADRVVVPAIKKNTRQRRRAGNRRYGQPYNPSNPWGWASGVPGWDKSPPKLAPPVYVCFVADTIVATESGATRIDKLSPDDRVLTVDMEQRLSTTSTIALMHVAMTAELIRITLENEEIICTPQHPFWVIGQGWVPARTLQSHHMLLAADGTPVRLLSAEEWTAECPVPVYNLSINETKTYYVGQSRVLVHNKTEW